MSKLSDRLMKVAENAAEFREMKSVLLHSANPRLHKQSVLHALDVAIQNTVLLDDSLIQQANEDESIIYTVELHRLEYVERAVDIMIKQGTLDATVFNDALALARGAMTR